MKLRTGSSGVLAVQLSSDLDPKHARSFFRKNARDVIERMRNPTDPTNNVAAVMVAEFAIDPRLRAEARRSLDAAQSAAEARLAELCPLRQWLESEIEIVACDRDQRPLERFSLNLDTPDLESCCRSAMTEIQENRAYSTPEIHLEFRYKKAA